MTKRRYIFALSMVAVYILAAGQGYAEVIYADSGLVADIQAAVTTARDGDTVSVPAGTFLWDGNLDIPATKGLILQGAGIGNTVLDLQGYGINLRTAEGNRPARVTGFTIKGGPSSTTNGAIRINDNDEGSKDWRIDYCLFDFDETRSEPFNAIWIAGWTWGVVDHCVFDGPPRGVFIQMGFSDFTDPLYFGDYSWSQPIDWGGSQAVYIEDNVFRGASYDTDQAVEGRWGSRYVFRHNDVTDYEIDTHSGCENGHRGPLHVEIYNNTIKVAAMPHYRAIFLRGGTGVIFNNSITGFSNAIHVDYEQVCTSCSSPWDALSYVYPAQDQTGRGTDSGWGTPQAEEPLYEWNNTLDGQDADITVHINGCPSMGSFITLGRDYYNDTPKQGYTEYEYPHPLVSGGGGPELPPPLNLRLDD